ncbi:glycosyltransferase [Clostridium botulinum]|nr:glycosyltransferase [Clostridium botulinum]
MRDQDLREEIRNYIQQGMLKDAEDMILQYKNIIGYDDEIASMEAILNIYNGDYNNALICIRRGLEINIFNGDLYFTMGNIYEIQGEYNRAYLCYEHALGLNNKENKDIILSTIENLKFQHTIKVNNYSIVILTYNNLDYTKICIDSIKKYNINQNYELIIVDNNSTDGTKEWLKEQKGIKYILNEENRGFPAGCNQGIKIAKKNNDIFLLNNDTVIISNSTFNLRMGLYSNENVGATGAVSNSVSYYQQISDTYNNFDEYMNFALKNNIANETCYEQRLKLVGFAMLIKRDVLDKVGLLDERFTPGNFEDDDISLRILREGYKLLLCKDSYIHHFGSVSFKNNINEYSSILKNNSKKFEEKWKVKAEEIFELRYDLISKIKFNIIPQKRQINVLDIGCGLGATLNKIKQVIPNVSVYGIENNNIICRNVRELGILTDIQHIDHINFKDIVFDIIIISNEKMEYVFNNLISNINVECQIIKLSKNENKQGNNIIEEYININLNLKKAEQCEREAKISQAIKIYRKIINENQNVNPSIYFKLGTLLIYKTSDYCEEKIIEGINLLIKAYDMNYYTDNIISVLVNLLSISERNLIKRRYNQNRNFIINNSNFDYNVIPKFEQLRFIIILITKNIVFLYDKELKKIIQSSNTLYGGNILLQLGITNREQLDYDYIINKLYKKEKNNISYNLFKKIENDLDTGISNEELLKHIYEYHRIQPQCDKYYYILSRYYLNKNDLITAENKINKALEVRKYNISYNNIMAEVYERKNDFIKAIRYYAYIKTSNCKKINFDIDFKINQCLLKSAKISNEYLNEVIHELSVGISNIAYFPRKVSCYFDEKEVLNQNNELYFGKFINDDTNDKYKNFIGITNNGYKNCGYENAAILSNSGVFNSYMKLRTEIIKSTMLYENTYIIKEYDIVIPICGTEYNQIVNFEYKSKKESYSIAKGEFIYLRINQDVKIYSKNYIIFGNPIKMKHKNERKKLILDIFIDALSFEYIKNREYEDIPNIMNYFKDGIIFENNYSVGEYTFPVTASMITGLYNEKTQMFNNKINIPLGDNIRTTAQVFNELGYYCTQITNDQQTVYSNYMKGFDTSILQFGYEFRANEVVENAIKHLEAFNETDNYLLVSFMEVHRALEDITKNIDVQVKNSFEQIFENKTVLNSVFTPQTHVAIEDYKSNIRDVDRVLGYLFDYVNKSYNQEDIVVSLISDHGGMLLDDDKFLLKKIHTNTALMIKGSEVPKVGLVKDEITSIVDFHKILTHICNCDVDTSKLNCKLPHVLGGDGRDYTISESLYTGQTYKLCIRNLKYEFRLETEDFTRYDGRINMENYKYIIHSLETNKQIYDREIEKYFLNIAYKHTLNLNDPYYEFLDIK